MLFADLMTLLETYDVIFRVNNSNDFYLVNNTQLTT